MSIVALLLLGLVAGFIGSKIANNRGEGVIGDIVVGIIGAFVPYVLRQADRHCAALDRAHDGSALPDLLGLRRIDPNASQRLSRALPRLGLGQLVPLLGPIGTTELADAPLSLPHLADAAAASLALPDLHGRDAERVAARGAAVLAASRHAGTKDLADALGISTRAVRKIRASSVDPLLVRSVALQAKLRWRLE